MLEIAILIDGGNLRALSRQAGRHYDPGHIEKVALSCAIQSDEQILRILYYDCAPYDGSVKLPVSGSNHRFYGSDAWLHELARKELFAVRRGILKFRGYRPRSVPISPGSVTDQDFEPVFEQKGVDMRIGLDIALYSTNHAVDHLVLIIQDTDCVPAMKEARRAGLQIVLVNLPNSTLAPELLEHCDFLRSVSWPP
jgi:uncharacterized LabA/DUF88 family protein